MVILESILGLVVGAIGGFFGGFILGCIAGLIAGDSKGWAVLGFVTFLCTVGGAIIGFVLPIKAASDRQAKLAEEERQKQQAQEAEARRQKELREVELRRRTEHLSRLLSDSRNTFAETRGLVPAAESHLDRAEEEFQEGAFAPFWDEIEHAINKLAAYQRGIETIHRNSVKYYGEANTLPVQPPTFDMPTRELPDARPVASRLAAIVRRAQKNFQFATIYEQRKTNQILVAGFGTLASAIYTIGDAISGSLNDLANSLHTSLDGLLDLTREHSRKAESASNSHTEMLAELGKQATADAAKRRQFEEKVIKTQEKQERILEKIERNRKP